MAGIPVLLPHSGNGAVGLLFGEHGACAHQHFGHFFDDAADGFLCRSGAEGDLSRRKAAFYQRFCQGNCLVGVLDGDNGHDTDFVNLLQNFVHGSLAPFLLSGTFRYAEYSQRFSYPLL